MENQVTQQYLVGCICVVIGILGWILPYRWNILRFRRFLARIIPESANRIVPKVIGSILLAVGATIVVATLINGEFK